MSWEVPQAARLPDGRLHLHHGPIDLIIESFGPGAERSYGAAVSNFQPVLIDLARELSKLRRPIEDDPKPKGPVALMMATAVRPYAPAFVTPMAAVAGAVADYVLAAVAETPGVAKAYVNNGGDVAFFLTAGTEFNAGVFAEQPGVFQVGYSDPARGVATSGWRGRSHSLGIADAVTVLADTAAAADVAATLIANAVDLPGSPKIKRMAAEELSPDSDLGDRMVTVAVDTLTGAETAAALDQGAAYAAEIQARGLISQAALQLNGDVRVVGAAVLG